MRAAFTGLSLRHGRAVLARALLEGVAYAMREQLDHLRGCGVRVDELRVSGGVARLATWNRIKADVIGVPIRPAPTDATARGVAMLAGIGSGLYPDPQSAVDRAVRLGPAIEPDPSVTALYEAGFTRWRQLARARVARR
jgi:xylulokinase